MSAEAAIKQIKPANLPAPPQAAMEIMRACSDSAHTNKELANIVNNDPLLTAELLRVVNSPLFGISREVGNIANAITILGHKALRNLVLCIAVRDALGKKGIPGFDTQVYWEDALRRSVAARTLAEQLKADADACFTAGLLQDFGLLILFYLYPEKASAWTELRRQNPQQRLALEIKTFGTTHDAVVMSLAKAWQLPEELGAMLGLHHSYKKNDLTPSIDQGCRILYSADWLVCVFCSDERAEVLGKARAEVQEALGLTTEQIDECLAQMPSLVETAAGALGLRVEQQPDFEEILRSANVKLAEDNMSYQELAWELKKALADRDRYAENATRELIAAQEIQRSLLPVKSPDSVPIYGINRAAQMLSGDYYDFFEVENGPVFFTLADVAGKGITAALLMAKSCSLFHWLGKGGHSLSNLLYILNNEICETSTRGMFVTMIAGCYYPESDRVELINAGHLPVLIIKPDGDIVEVAAQGPPLGIMQGADFKPVRFKLGKNLVYAFTDGVTECKVGGEGEMLEIEGTKKIIGEYASLEPQQRLQSIVDQLIGDSVEVQDDITMLVLDNSYGR